MTAPGTVLLGRSYAAFSVLLRSAPDSWPVRLLSAVFRTLGARGHDDLLAGLSEINKITMRWMSDLHRMRKEEA